MIFFKEILFFAPPAPSQLTYDGQYLTYKPDWAPTEVSCARFVPYIDHRNGYVYARWAALRQRLGGWAAARRWRQERSSHPAPTCSCPPHPSL